MLRRQSPRNDIEKAGPLLDGLLEVTKERVEIASCKAPRSDMKGLAPLLDALLGRGRTRKAGMVRILNALVEVTERDWRLLDALLEREDCFVAGLLAMT